MTDLPAEYEPETGELARAQLQEQPEPVPTFATVVEEWLHTVHDGRLHHPGDLLDLLAAEGVQVVAVEPLSVESLLPPSTD